MNDIAGLAVRPRNIGARIKRVEDRRLLTGQGLFTDDRAIAKALHLAFRRSDHAHALIASIDTRSAAKMAGVVGVYTAAELADLAGPVCATSRMQHHHATPIYPLARGKVRFVGEAVVAVVAQSRSLAEDALERIEVAYEPLSPIVDPMLAVRDGKPLLHPDAGTNVLAAREFVHGDVEAEMAAAPVRVGGRFRFAARHRPRWSRARALRNTSGGVAVSP